MSPSAYGGLVLFALVVSEVHLGDILGNLRDQLFTLGPEYMWLLKGQRLVIRIGDTKILNSSFNFFLNFNILMPVHQNLSNVKGTIQANLRGGGQIIYNP